MRRVALTDPGDVDGSVTTTAATPIPAHSIQPESGPADTGQPVIVVHSCTTRGDTLTVHLAGEIDCWNAGPLRVMLTTAAAYGYTHLVLDTSRVTFRDSALLKVLESWVGAGRTACLENPSRAAQRLLSAAVGGLPFPPGLRPSGLPTNSPTAGQAERVRT